MWRSTVIFFVVLSLVKGQNSSEVSQCIRHSGDVPINTYIEGCLTPPCQLPQLQDVVFHLIFRIPHTIHAMTTLATAYMTIGIITVPIDYNLQESSVTCNFLTNTYCPVIKDEIVQYTLRMYIEPFFPVGTSVTIEFRIVDDNQVPIVCMRVPIRIIQAIDNRILAQNATLTDNKL